MTVSTVAPQTDERRASRYLARFHLWKHSALRRVQSCGRVGRTEGVAVKMTESAELGPRAGWSGVATCGSVWVCPVCSAKIAAYRQSQIEKALTVWHDRGGRVALATFTMKHQRGQALADLWDGVSYAWGRVTSGRSWQADQTMFGVPMARTIRSGKRAGEVVIENRIRMIRVVEVTWGEGSGWHVHIHALLLLGAGVDTDGLETVVAAMFTRWRDALVASGFAAPEGRKVLGRDGRITRPGWDARMLDGDPASALGEYFTKSVYNARNASLEAARGDLKDARGGNLTPFGILRSLVTTGEEGAEILAEVEAARRQALWAEWETASKGRRQIAWTAGLKDELMPEDDDLADEEIVELDEGGAVVAVVDNQTYAEVAKSRATYAVLAAFERSPAEGWALLEIFQARAGLEEHERGPGHRRRAEAALAENWA